MDGGDGGYGVGGRGMMVEEPWYLSGRESAVGVFGLVSLHEEQTVIQWSGFVALDGRLEC